jgi:hypothetical protein
MYGGVFDSVNISSNGYLTTAQYGSDYGNTCLPQPDFEGVVIAGFFDDLKTYDQGSIYYQTFDDSLIVQYDAVEPYSGTGTVTFQIVLYRDGTVYLYYKEMSVELLSATVGIQNDARDIGLNVVCNTSYLHDELAVKIYNPNSWLSFSPASGSVAPTDQQDVTFALSADRLDAGSYQASVKIAHNDPSTGPVIVPILFEVYPSGVGGLSVFRIGSSSLSKATGAALRAENILIGSGLNGSAQNQNYKVRLR